MTKFNGALDNEDRVDFFSGATKSSTELGTPFLFCASWIPLLGCHFLVDLLFVAGFFVWVLIRIWFGVSIRILIGVLVWGFD